MVSLWYIFEVTQIRKVILDSNSSTQWFDIKTTPWCTEDRNQPSILHIFFKLQNRWVAEEFKSPVYAGKPANMLILFL